MGSWGTHRTDWELFTLVSSRVWITARANLEFLARVTAFWAFISAECLDSSLASGQPNNLPSRIVRTNGKRWRQQEYGETSGASASSRISSGERVCRGHCSMVAELSSTSPDMQQMTPQETWKEHQSQECHFHGDPGQPD